MELCVTGHLGLPFPQSKFPGGVIQVAACGVLIPVFIARRYSRGLSQFVKTFTAMGPRLTFPVKASLNVNVTGVV